MIFLRASLWLAKCALRLFRRLELTDVEYFIFCLLSLLQMGHKSVQKGTDMTDDAIQSTHS